MPCHSDFPVRWSSLIPSHQSRCLLRETKAHISYTYAMQWMSDHTALASRSADYAIRDLAGRPTRFAPVDRFILLTDESLLCIFIHESSIFLVESTYHEHPQYFEYHSSARTGTIPTSSVMIRKVKYSLRHRLFCRLYPLSHCLSNMSSYLCSLVPPGEVVQISSVKRRGE